MRIAPLCDTVSQNSYLGHANATGTVTAPRRADGHSETSQVVRLSMSEVNYSNAVALPVLVVPPDDFFLFGFFLRDPRSRYLIAKRKHNIIMIVRFVVG